MESMPNNIQVIHGNYNSLSQKIKDFVASKIELCQPENLHICDGSEEEAKLLTELLVKNGTAEKLENMDNWLVNIDV